ncbi:MAG TPA: hypothetical protein VFA41_19780 [Ktedonobacteraceae bacterium]|jgi:hypothetical protein|nr:hypothetical protein [Ktedonobacteraceae bacterium]
MPKQEYALNVAGVNRVKVYWNGNTANGGRWDDVAVLLDENTVGTLEQQEDLMAGFEYRLRDDSLLKVQLVNKQLHVTRDGTALSSVVDEHPLQVEPIPTSIYIRWGLASCVIFLIGLLNVVLGFLIVLLQQQEFPYDSPNYIPLLFGLVIGAVFVLLGVFVVRKSAGALNTAIGLYIVDGLFALFQLNWVGVVIHIVLLALMFMGIEPVRRLRAIATGRQY